MTQISSGKQGEDAVVQYLEKRGYKIRETNWRTRWCEIDIVAEQNEVIYFVEVKYRQSSRQGDGLEYITDKKLQQMAFAAELWISSHDWRGGYELAAAAVSGSQFTVDNFIVI